MKIWKGKAQGFEADHWFVIPSGQERLEGPKGAPSLKDPTREPGA